MSLANLGEIQTAIQARGYGSDTAAAQIEFVNAVYREIFRERRWTWRQATAAGVLVVGNPVANLSGITDMDGVPDAVRLEINQTYIDLDYIEPEEFRRREHFDRTNGVPSVWTWFGGSVRVYPRPDQAYTVDVDYFKKYTPLVNPADVPLIPEEHRDVLVYGALKDLAARERDFWFQMNWSQAYEGVRAEIRAADNRRPRQTTSRVRKSGFYPDSRGEPFPR